MEASWHPNRSTIDASCEKRFFENQCSHSCGSIDFQDAGVQDRSKNGYQIDQKTKSTWEGILTSNFHRVWWTWGAKLGGKIEPRSIKNGIDKNNGKKKSARMAKKSQQEAATTLDTTGPGPWGGGRGRCAPLPRGSKTEGLKRRGNENILKYISKYHSKPREFRGLVGFDSPRRVFHCPRVSSPVCFPLRGPMQPLV